jgi:hypothetical protein
MFRHSFTWCSTQIVYSVLCTFTCCQHHCTNFNIPKTIFDTHACTNWDEEILIFACYTINLLTNQRGNKRLSPAYRHNTYFGATLLPYARDSFSCSMNRNRSLNFCQVSHNLRTNKETWYTARIVVCGMCRLIQSYKYQLYSFAYNTKGF